MLDLKRTWSALFGRSTPHETGDQGSERHAFHGDRLYRELAMMILSDFHASSFCETGTYLGHTAEFVARHHPHLPVLTTEVSEPFFQLASQSLRKYAHVTLVNQSSEQFLREAIDRELLGPLPVFFLDAHWYDYWPLADEVALIASRLSRWIAIIDDFQVPGREDFAYCVGGGGSSEFSGRTTLDKRICNLELIRDGLGTLDEYRFLYPNYRRDQAFPSEEGSLIAYVIIFKNLVREFNALADWKIVHDYFTRIPCSRP